MLQHVCEHMLIPPLCILLFLYFMLISAHAAQIIASICLQIFLDILLCINAVQLIWSQDWDTVTVLWDRARNGSMSYLQITCSLICACDILASLCILLKRIRRWRWRRREALRAIQVWSAFMYTNGQMCSAAWSPCSPAYHSL